ncbi:MAG TPA: DUF2339 domain-containing protein, partial [Fimbriimonas sp.]
AMWEVWMPLMLLGSLAMLSNSIEVDDEKANIYYVSAIGGWYLLSRFGFLVLGPLGLGMNPNAAVTTAWILTALVLLALGFAADRIQLRLASFAVLFSTVLKIVFVDLAKTDQAIKVVILMLLGLVMLGGGYWYIHHRPGAGPQAPAT